MKLHVHYPSPCRYSIEGTFRLLQRPRFPDICRTHRYGTCSRMEGLQKCPATIETLGLLRNVAVYSLNMKANQSRRRRGGEAEFRKRRMFQRKPSGQSPNQWCKTSAAVSIPKADSHMLARSDRNHDLVALSMRPHGKKLELPSSLHQTTRRSP
jgi:hypothetical protein